MILDFASLQLALPKFVDEAKLHFHAFGIGELILDRPIAHVGITPSTKEEYQEYLEHYRPLSTQQFSLTLDGREHGYFKLQAPLKLAERQVDTVEVIAPLAGDLITTAGMIDHLTYPVTDLTPIRQRLEAVGLKPLSRKYPDGETLGVEFNEYLQEVRFTSFNSPQ